jgi:ParB/RepB/Spo0J family partition protein
MDCVNLANDLAKRGLQQPVTIRPLREETPSNKPHLVHEQDLIKKGFKYKAIAGHRRITSYKINQHLVIPSILKPQYMEDFDAKDLNAIENLQRMELTLWQEARAIKHYWIADWTRSEIAERIQKSDGWVQIRLMLLGLEPEIQELANAGLLKQADIQALDKIGDRTERLQTAGAMRDAYRRGEKTTDLRIPKKPKASSKKFRTKGEIMKLNREIQAVLSQADLTGEVGRMNLVTPQGNFFGTSLMAWAAGEIPTREVYMGLRNFAELFGIDYTLPEFQDQDLLTY